MSQFCWNSARRSPPGRWDLRRAGWRLCAGGTACGSAPGEGPEEVRLIDARQICPGLRRALLGRERLPGQAVLLGVELPGERAALLAAGCGEALPSSVGLAELAERARRLARRPEMLPRLRRAGPVMLDLFHRDGRVEGPRGPLWLALHPREFELLWRLAERPGARVSRAELLRDVWRLAHEPETNSLAVHVSRLRAKLADRGLEGLVATDPAGGYRLSDCTGL